MKKLIVLFFVAQPYIHAMENKVQETWQIKKQFKMRYYIKSATYNEPSKQLLLRNQKNVTLVNIENNSSIELPHFSSSWKLSFDSTGRYFVANINPQKAITLFDTDAKEITNIITENYPYIVSFNHQGDQILIADKNNVQLRNLDGALITNYKLEPECWIKIAKFFPNNDNLIFIAPSAYHEIKYKPKLWDIRTKNVIAYDYIDYLKKVSIHPEGSYLASIPQLHNVACIYDLRKNGYAHFTHKSCSAKFNSKGTHILTKYDDLYLALLWNAQHIIQSINNKECLNALAFKPENLCGATFHPDGNTILTYSTKITPNSENNLIIWDLNGNQVAKLPHEKQIYSAKYDKTGNYIISRHEDNIVTVWKKEKSD